MFTPHSIRHPLKAAIAWQVISEIAKRHRQPEDLRVVEMHPGGGQYNLLRLLRGNNPNGLIYDSANQILADFNLATGQLSNPFTESTQPFSWLERWLVCDDIDDLMAAMQPVVGMEGIKHRPDDSRAVFGFTLIASIMTSQMTSECYLRVKNGFVDTSGDGGGISSILSRFPALFASHSRDHDELKYDAAAKCWMILQGVNGAIVGCIRTDGSISSSLTPERAHDLFQLYLETKSMSAATCAALETLGLL